MYAWVLLAAAAVAAVADWAAVGAGRREVELVAKPAYVALLGAFAWLLHAEQAQSGWWLLVALFLCLVGDVLLLSDSDQAFGMGLVTFLLAHVAFIGALLSMTRRPPLWLGVVVTVAVVGLVVAFVLWPLARRDLAEGVPPTVYAVVIGLFVALAWWSGHVLLGLGASLFLVSDAALAAGRFWRELPGHRVVVMVTYHVALLLLVLGILRPDLVAA